MLFKAKSITKVGAGDGFSVFASDNGILMTCGDGTLGCLGKGAFSNCVDRFLGHCSLPNKTMLHTPNSIANKT